MDPEIIAAIITGIVALSVAIIRYKPQSWRDRLTKGNKASSIVTKRHTTCAHPPNPAFPTYSAPACVFLSGEHAVMFGHAALYLPIPLRLRVRVEPDEKVEGVRFAEFLVPDPSKPEVKKPIGECQHYNREIGREEERKLQAFFTDVILPYVSTTRDGSPLGFRFFVDSDFPVACGLNGSGAIAACVASAFVKHYMNMENFRTDMRLTGSSNDDITHLIAWMIENCFHGGKGSGAGVTAALAGRSGLHPIVYFSGKRSLLKHRIADGWPGVAVGDGAEGLHRLSQLQTYMFDPSAGKSDVQPYDPPPKYNISLVYTGNPSKTGDMLRDPLSQVATRHGKLAAAFRNTQKQLLPYDILSHSVRCHLHEAIKNVYSEQSLTKTERNRELDQIYHELLCDGMGITSILMMNSVLSDWTAVPQLITCYQDSLRIAGASNSEIDKILHSLSQKADELGMSEVAAGKTTGCGGGGDVLIITVNPNAKLHNDLVDAVAAKTKKPIHFRSTDNQYYWSQVQGIQHEQ